MMQADDSREEHVDGVRLRHYSAFTTLLLDQGKGGDWAECAQIETFANAGNTITMILEGDDDANFNDGDPYEGRAVFSLTPAEARWLGKWLVAEAGKAEARSVR